MAAKLRSIKSPDFTIDRDKACEIIDKTDQIVVSDITQKIPPPQVLNPDAKHKISSINWLKKYGLEAYGLDTISLYPKLGFPRLMDFNKVLKKTIFSKYGDKLFPMHFREDGVVFNIVAKKEHLLNVQQQLESAVDLYNQRLHWLKSESRRMFGVIEEYCITLIIDIKTKDTRQFDQFLCALERLINEQLRQCLKFNIIRVENKTCKFSPKLTPVTKESINSAIDWLWGIDKLSTTSSANLVEALIRANHDKENEAICLITEGKSSDGSREVMRNKVKQLKIPLHIISYNCKTENLLNYFKELTEITGGRFHTYIFDMDMDLYEAQKEEDMENKGTPSAIITRRRVFGTSFGGIGSRQDCMLIFNELEEAKSILSQVKTIINQIPESHQPYDAEEVHDDEHKHVTKEEYMSSAEWLNRFGLKARKLDIYDVLAGVCFKHCDGVVDVLGPPKETIDLMEQQDAVVRQKLVNAKYCDKFAHVRWKDGTLVHVQMSADVHRLYAQRMQICLNGIHRRIGWLREGSRELFGTIMESHIYILIDTSASMAPHITFVKEKLYSLIQEQLRHKCQINFVGFNSKIFPWRDRMVDVTATNLKSAWNWIDNLTCQGSTNTLGALQLAVKDQNCHGVYLLTDGRPDQPPLTIISQLHLQHKLPIHCISFNCSDLEANRFLYDLARETGGRFHYFNEITGSADCGNGEQGIEAWESEDIRLLKDEYQRGKEYLNKVTNLRDECHKLAWKKEIDKRMVENPKRQMLIPKCDEGLSIRKKKIVNTGAISDNKKKIKARNTFREEIKSMDGKAYISFLQNMGAQSSEDNWVLKETQEILDRQTEYYEANMRKLAEKNKVKPKRPKCRNLTLHQWLAIYGLVPQQMTILDALAPTIIRVKPRYVPIIDKHVISRVFQEIMPVSHLVTEEVRGGGQKPVVRLVNPLAVDLNKYQTRLKTLIKKHHKKLREIVLKNFGEEEVRKLEKIIDRTSLGSQDVMDWVMALFGNADWPECEVDVANLLRELATGEKYMLQADDLINYRRHGVASEKEADIESVGFKDNNMMLVPDNDTGYFYEARVLKFENDYLEVEFLEQEMRGRVHYMECIPLKIPDANEIWSGAKALVKVLNMDTKEIIYLPGVIISGNDEESAAGNKYNVILYNGFESNVLLEELVLLSDEKYNDIVENIGERSNQNLTLSSANSTTISTSIMSDSGLRKDRKITSAKHKTSSKHEDQKNKVSFSKGIVEISPEPILADDVSISKSLKSVKADVKATGKGLPGKHKVRKKNQRTRSSLTSSNLVDINESKSISNAPESVRVTSEKHPNDLVMPGEITQSAVNEMRKDTQSGKVDVSDDPTSLKYSGMQSDALLTVHAQYENRIEDNAIKGIEGGTLSMKKDSYTTGKSTESQNKISKNSVVENHYPINNEADVIYINDDNNRYVTPVMLAEMSVETKKLTAKPDEVSKDKKQNKDKSAAITKEKKLVTKESPLKDVIKLPPHESKDHVDRKAPKQPKVPTNSKTNLKQSKQNKENVPAKSISGKNTQKTNDDNDMVLFPRTTDIFDSSSDEQDKNMTKGKGITNAKDKLDNNEKISQTKQLKSVPVKERSSSIISKGLNKDGKYNEKNDKKVKRVSKEVSGVTSTSVKVEYHEPTDDDASKIFCTNPDHLASVNENDYCSKCFLLRSPIGPSATNLTKQNTR